MDYKPRKTTCSTKICKNKSRPGQRTCYTCHRDRARVDRKKRESERRALREALDAALKELAHG